MAYLGQKGYTISKADLKPTELDKIRNDLTIKPQVHGAPIAFGAANNVSFPAYRESPNKIYVPLYYGISNFGMPKSVKVSHGIDINIPFAGTLRENQIPVVDAYMKAITANPVSFGGGLLELPCAYGKCLGKDTKVLMYNGDVKNVQDIVVGDVLMGDDSTPRNVLTLARGREQMYRISSKKGDSYTCNESHILSLKSSSNS